MRGRRHRQGRRQIVRLIEPAELRSWIVHEDEELLVINKPGSVVCHPSKQGPWSSLIGACREYTGLATLHMPSRLDRETSGVVLFAKTHALGSQLQRAIQARRVRKRYLAILHGRLAGSVLVDQPIGPRPGAVVVMEQTVRADGAAARTEFRPLAATEHFTLAEVEPQTGRMHQIRVHARWLGHSIVGDKIYGPDPALFLEFIEQGFTPALARELLLERQALHAASIRYDVDPPAAFEAPLAPDLVNFCQAHGINQGSSSPDGPCK